MKTRAALAIVLFCAAALLLPDHHPAAPTADTVVLRRGPSPFDLPDDCAIVASEAASRLAATGAWTRIVLIKYCKPQSNRTFSHALTVWQPPTAHVVFIYDGWGGLELSTTRHEPTIIGKEWAHIARVTFIDAHFIK